MCAPTVPSALEIAQYSALADHAAARADPLGVPVHRAAARAEPERPGREAERQRARTGTAPPARNGRTAGSIGRSTSMAPVAISATGTP